MSELLQLALGLAVLALGIPAGNFLAKQTKEELKDGSKWFKIIIVFSVIGAILGLILKNDVLLFSLLFIAIVTSRSLVRKKSKK
ncbi:MAG TPA: hypothetical protein VJH92_06280 [Candidatus Nanoarchaeia archaeon]|nr:hypothetical protein [Candidatus Nanoarchaeia archaeon]